MAHSVSCTQFEIWLMPHTTVSIVCSDVPKLPIRYAA